MRKQWVYVVCVCACTIAGLSCQEPGTERISKDTVAFGQDIGYRRFDSCSNMVYKDLEFFIEHEEDIDFNDYELDILLGGYCIYKRKFQKHIIVRQVPFCLDSKYDDDKTYGEFIRFHMIGMDRKIRYRWSRKQTYLMLQRPKMYVRLLSNGEYDAKYGKEDDWNVLR